MGLVARPNYYGWEVPTCPRLAIATSYVKACNMARRSCLAAITPKDSALLGAALAGAGEPAVAIVARLDVVELHKLAPDVLIVDVDEVAVDPLETLRQIRFVLPNCLVLVYTAGTTVTWGRACHLAGVNGVLCKASDESELVTGLRSTIRSGCFTDPRLVA